MTLFDSSGHAAAQALLALADYRLDEEETLALCEHLSQCEQCQERYTQILEEDSSHLLECSQSVTDAILAQCVEQPKAAAPLPKKKNAKVLTLSILKMAVAAAITLVIWAHVEDLSWLSSLGGRPQQGAPSTPVSQVFTDVASNIQQGLTQSMGKASQFFEFRFGGQSQPVPDSNQPSAENH